MEKAGLYIHIPFCKSKCPYCSFYSVKYDKAQAECYVNSLIAEMKKYNGCFDTIYLGGGTPSILEPELIGKIINSAKEHFDIDKNAEITIECNPSKDLENDFMLYKEYGINRISLGMQSAKNEERLALGRSANQQQVAKAIQDARAAGITNISLDVMLGTPQQTISSLDETFDFISKMDVPHISAYMLKIEEGTKFFELQDKLKLADEDTVCNMYLKTVESLKALGIKQYEISNFAKPGFESRHNNKYWKMVDYLGIGKSAHSFWQGERFYYDKDFNKIIDSPVDFKEEEIMLGLRLTDGIKKSLISKDYSQFIKLGYINDLGDNIALTPKGMLISNYIISQLI